MAEMKTQRTEASVPDFLAAIADPQQRADAETLVALFRKWTKAAPVLWGPSILGFGDLPVTYANGKTIDWFVAGFSPRKGKLAIYLTCDLAPYAGELAGLGKHTTGKGCLYVRRLADIDMKALEKLARTAIAQTRQQGWNSHTQSNRKC